MEKVVRGFAVHEVETDHGNSIKFHIDGDLTPNQIMSLCAFAILSSMQDDIFDKEDVVNIANAI